MSPNTLFYLRLTVIISDLVYYYGVYMWLKLMFTKQKDKFRNPFPFITIQPVQKISNSFFSTTSFIYITLFLFNVGHFIVDHIHFQYNGFLNGLLLISMAFICNQQIFLGAFWFAVLLNFKHIYIYLAPAFFIHLFVDYCLLHNQYRHIKIRFDNLIRLFIIVSGVFLISFLPFILKGQFWNVINRLFPFKRGLSHAYWAPNFWALYNGLDLILAKFYLTEKPSSSFTSGLVQQSKHLILPEITPFFTMIVTLVIITVSNFKFQFII